jgi:hypothetical protein
MVRIRFHLKRSPLSSPTPNLYVKQIRETEIPQFAFSLIYKILGEGGLNDYINRTGRSVGVAVDLYPGCGPSESRTGHRLSRMRFFVVFLCLSGKIPGLVPPLGHYHFIPNHFQVNIDLRDTESVVKNPQKQNHSISILSMKR